MALETSIRSQRILVRLTHSLVLSRRTPHRTKSRRRCSPSRVLTSYISVTFDKLRSITEKDVLLQSVKKLINSRWSDLRLLRQHAKWSQLEEFYRRQESSRLSKNVRTADKSSQTSSPRTSGDPTNEVTRAKLRVLAGYGT